MEDELNEGELNDDLDQLDQFDIQEFDEIQTGVFDEFVRARLIPELEHYRLLYVRVTNPDGSVKIHEVIEDADAALEIKICIV